MTANKKKAAGLVGRLNDEDPEADTAGSETIRTSDMLATCADDGTVKVWALPSSPLAPLVAVDPIKEASGTNIAEDKVSRAEVATGGA